MKNTEKIASVVTPLVGLVLTSKEITALVLERFPDTNPASILPSDHAGANPRSGAVYADQLFAREGNGKFRVLAVADRVSKPRTGRSSQSLTDALASVKAKIAVAQASTGERETPSQDASTVTDAELEQLTAPESN